MRQGSSGDKFIVEDIFTIQEMDRGGKKFDKVSRIEAKSEQLELDLTLDVNTEIYPMSVGQKYTIALAPTLNLDGTLGDDQFDQSGRYSLADKFDYVMYGKLYKYSGDENKSVSIIEVFVSFGGLLMKLKGEATHLKDFQLDQRLYILIRRVG